jgi:hypothetical protein
MFSPPDANIEFQPIKLKQDIKCKAKNVMLVPEHNLAFRRYVLLGGAFGSALLFTFYCVATSFLMVNYPVIPNMTFV